MNRSRSEETLRWRTPLGAWRWAILSSLGVASQACGGRADSPDFDGAGGSLATQAPRGSGASPAGAGGLPGLSPGSLTGGGASDVPTDDEVVSAPFACAGVVELDVGLLRCDNGMVHRALVAACTELVLTPSGLRSNPCLDDAACNSGQLCSCGEGCVAASCRSDADCAPGMLCASPDGCASRFACQRPDDVCAVDADCPPGLYCLLRLAPDAAQPIPGPSDYLRRCLPDFPPPCPGELVPGRPFLIAGAERLAPCMPRDDWYSDGSVAARSASPSAELRETLARGWLQQALMEHASVAAFARFALQLLSLGAPAELVAGAATAMQDEIRHARDCFQLARRHSDVELGPGPLPVEGALEQFDLTDIVLTTVREGCVGETVAALEAAEALQHCEDAEARAVLERIAAEETEHARLAWRFVAWALQKGTAELATRVREAFDEFAPAHCGANEAVLTVSMENAELARHGLLGAPVRQALRRRVLQEVAAPCAEALLRGTQLRPSPLGLRVPPIDFTQA